MSARLFNDGFYVLVVTFPADIAEIGLLERLIEPVVLLFREFPWLRAHELVIVCLVADFIFHVAVDNGKQGNAENRVLEVQLLYVDLVPVG